VTAEMPVAGGFYVSYSVDSVPVHPYIDNHQLFYLAVQLLFIIITGFFVLRTLRDLMALGVVFYSTPRCWIDLCLAVSSTLLVTVFIYYSALHYRMSPQLSSMQYRQLFYLDRLLLTADGLVGLFAILRVLLLCRYVPLMSRVLDVLDKSSPYVVSSVLFGLFAWLVISSSSSALFGHSVLPLRSVSSSLTTTVYAVTRVYDYDVSRALSASIVLMLFVLLLFYVARAMCAVTLLATFRDVCQLPQSQLTRLYFAQMTQNFLDFIGCVGLNTRSRQHVKPAAKLI